MLCLRWYDEPAHLGCGDNWWPGVRRVANSAKRRQQYPHLVAIGVDDAAHLGRGDALVAAGAPGARRLHEGVAS